MSSTSANHGAEARDDQLQANKCKIETDSDTQYEPSEDDTAGTNLNWYLSSNSGGIPEISF